MSSRAPLAQDGGNPGGFFRRNGRHHPAPGAGGPLIQIGAGIHPLYFPLYALGHQYTSVGSGRPADTDFHIRAALFCWHRLNHKVFGVDLLACQPFQCGSFGTLLCRRQPAVAPIARQIGPVTDLVLQ